MIFKVIIDCIMVVGIGCLLIFVLMIFLFVLLMMFAFYYDYYNKNALLTISKLRKRSLYCDDF